MPLATALNRCDGPYLAVLAALGLALGHLEAIAAHFVRHLLDVAPVTGNLGPAMFDHAPAWLVTAEQSRQVAAALLLLAMAWLVGRSYVQRLGALFFVLACRVAATYSVLWLISDWPRSLQNVDLVWLVPHPVFAPVWLPLTAATAMALLALGLFSAARGGKS